MLIAPRLCLFLQMIALHSILHLTNPSWYETPDNFVLASFMAVRIRALTLGMNHPVKCSEWWGDIALKELERMGLPYESWDEEQLMKYGPEISIQKFDM